MWRRDVRAAVRFEKVRLKKPAASFPARAFEILAMVNICR
jgi:hypothetical protein